jgi:hypothetical protein
MWIGGFVAILGTIVLILWQSNFRAFDNGDCFTLTVAATTIAYLTAISMMIRWRWVRAFSSYIFSSYSNADISCGGLEMNG